MNREEKRELARENARRMSVMGKFIQDRKGVVSMVIGMTVDGPAAGTPILCSDEATEGAGLAKILRAIADKLDNGNTDRVAIGPTDPAVN